MLEARYEDGGTPQARLPSRPSTTLFRSRPLSTSSSAAATVSLSSSCARPPPRRSSTTSAHFAAISGILYLDDFTPASAEGLRRCPRKLHPLFDATVHVFVSERHPLARRPQLSLADLTPYTRYSFEQGTSNSFYYAEEPFSYIPCDRNIRISDRGTLTNLLITSNGYTLSTGVLSNEMQWGMASIPLADAPTMHVGYIMHDERKPSPLLRQYLDELNRIIHAN